MSEVYLIAILLGTTDDILLRVDPVELLVEWVVVNGSDIAQAVNGKDDVRALLLIHYHAING